MRAVRGHPDPERSPALGAVLGTVIDHGHRSASMEPDGAVPASDGLGPKQSVEVSPAPVGGVDGPTPHRRWVTTAAACDDRVVESALQLVVALARATVDSADGVSVSLRREGRLATVAASDRTVSDMDADQYVTGEGPCVDASADGRWFHVASLDDETRWPAFTPRARALGISAILSAPLLARDGPVGALNMYSRTTSGFAPEDQRLASVFATAASIIVTNAAVDATDDRRSTGSGSDGEPGRSSVRLGT
jgi:hypothetical protein